MTKFLLNEIKKRDLLLKMTKSAHVKIIKKRDVQYKALNDMGKQVDLQLIKREIRAKNVTKFLLLKEKQIDEVILPYTPMYNLEIPDDIKERIENHMTPCCGQCLENGLNQFDDLAIAQKQKEIEDFFDELEE